MTTRTAPHEPVPTVPTTPTTDEATTEAPPETGSDPGTDGPTVEGTTDVADLALVESGFSVSERRAAAAPTGSSS